MKLYVKGMLFIHFYGSVDYLGGFENDWKKMTHHIDEKTAVDVLPVGHIPPNPAELLQSDRMQKLITRVKR